MSDSIDRQTARALLRGSVVCDMTLPLIDIPGADMRKKLASLERYAAAGFDFVSVTVAVDDADPAEAIRLIARERRFYEDRPDQFILVETAADIDRARRDGKLAVGFHFQGTGPIGRNLDLVALYYKLGIRHMLMAYNQKNLVGNGCHELSDDGYFAMLQSAGFAPRLFEKEAIERATRVAPANSPATMRGHYIREFVDGEEPVTANWKAVIIGHRWGAKTIRLANYGRSDRRSRGDSAARRARRTSYRDRN